MPSSLVFTALVVAWLAVLVPVVARRRQTVPRPADADLSARVLTRPDRSGAGVAPPSEEVPMPSVTTAPDEAATDHPDDDRVEGPAPRGRLLDRGRPREDDDPDDLDDRYDDESYGDLDDSDLDDRDLDDRELDDRDEGFAPEYRPRAYRPGRGGFDADADAVAAGARYAFRQRVALGLIALAVVSAIAALVVSSTLWWLHVVTDLALVGYLVFLRRQTRIEEEVRRRRLARLTGERRALEARRERQLEHEARLAGLDGDGWGPHPDAHDEFDGWEDELDDRDDELDDRDDDSDLDDDRDRPSADVPAPRWMAPRQTPEVPAGMELVADPDDDPAFHELSDSRVPAYRRMAAGA